MSFLSAHLIEIIASISGITGLWFVTRGSQWNWPFGIFTVSLYFFIFLKVHLYANMVLQLVFLSLQIYGFFQWRRGRTKEKNLAVRELNPAQRLQTALLTLALFSFSIPLLYFSNSTMIGLDALVTAVSITAQWLLSRRYIEHWYLWMGIDIVASLLYFQKALYFTSILHLIYLIFCVQGFIFWRSHQTKQALVSA